MKEIDLLKAEHVGIRRLRNELSKYAERLEPVVITNRGKPIKALVDYADLLSMLEAVKAVAVKRKGADTPPMTIRSRG